MSETQTPTPSKKQMSFSVLDSGEIEASFGPDIEPLRLNPADVPEAVQLLAISEGLISRSRGYVSRLEGEDRTPENMRAQVLKAFDNLRAGIWKLERGEGGGSADFTIEIEAAWLFRKMKAEAKNETFTETLGETAAMWGQLTDDEKDADGKVIAKGQKSQVKALPRYQQALAQVKARRAAEKAAKLAAKADADEADSPF